MKRLKNNTRRLLVQRTISDKLLELKEVRKTMRWFRQPRKLTQFPFRRPRSCRVRLDIGRGTMVVPGDAPSVSTRCEEHICKSNVKMVFVTVS